MSMQKEHDERPMVSIIVDASRPIKLRIVIGGNAEVTEAVAVKDAKYQDIDMKEIAEADSRNRR